MTATEPRTPARKAKRPKGRREPLSAEYAPCDNNGVAGKPIIVRSGRGDSRLTEAEARKLIADLIVAVGDLKAAEIEAMHAAHVAAGTVYDPTEKAK